MGGHGVYEQTRLIAKPRSRYSQVFVLALLCCVSGWVMRLYHKSASFRDDIFRFEACALGHNPFVEHQSLAGSRELSGVELHGVFANLC